MLVDAKLLVHLPAEIAGEVLCNWLDLRSVARVDSAMCCHLLRPQLLQLFASSCCTRRYLVNVHNITTTVKWLLARRLRLSRLEITTASTEVKAYLEMFSTTISSVSCFEGESLEIISMRCRNLRSLLCDGFKINVSLKGALQFNNELRELQIENVEELHASHFAGVCLPQLTLLSLFGTPCEDALVTVLVGATSKLQDICLGFCDFVTDVGVMAVAHHCPLLRRFGLNELQISDGAVAELTRLCPRIEKLDLSGNEVLTDSGVLLIAEKLRGLRSINISYCTGLTDLSLEHFAAHSAATLHTLHMMGMAQVRVDRLVLLLQTCHHLHTLALDCDLNSHFALILPHMNNLHSFASDAVVSDDALCMLAQCCKQLRKLSIPCYYVVNSQIYTTSATATSSERVMYCADAAVTDNDKLLTSRGILALIDGLPNLQLLVAPEVSDSGGFLSDIVQALWQRIRPGLRFEQDCESFYYRVLSD